MQPVEVTEGLLVKYAAGEADTAEQEQVQQWLLLSAVNRKQLADILQLFEQADKLPLPIPVDESTAWQKVQRRLEIAPVKRLPSGWLRVAAVFILLAGTALYFVFNTTKHAQPATTAMVDVFSEAGIRTDTLPDGSVVTLSGRSSLHYAADFAGKNREVRLEGEAYFSVAHNRARPFIVSVKDITVMVTGTSFTIRSYGPQTSVTVHTGVVRISRRAKDVTLLRGEMIFIAESDTALAKQLVQQNMEDTVPQKRAPQTDEGLADDVARQKTIIRNILRDIAQDELLPAGDTIQWFGLDWKKFMINSNVQPPAIYNKYKTKYLHLPGYGFYYGISSMSGKGFIFSKQELEQ